MNELRTLVQRYLDSWRAKDLSSMAQCLHPDVHFVGPTLRTEGREAFLRAAGGMFPLLVDHVVREMIIERDRAVAIYDFYCRPPIGCCRTAELIGFADGSIRSVEVFFDAQPFATPPSGSVAA